MFIERVGDLFIGRFGPMFREKDYFHGFSTRKGGTSRSPYSSLNLGFNSGDDQERVDRNRKLFCDAMKVTPDRLAVPQQVHGNRIQTIEAPGQYSETDAMITSEPGIVLTVQVADCVPIWLVDPARKAAGLIHAGWRGSALSVAGKTVERMVYEFGSSASDLYAFIGPSIGPCCYEVGQEVLDRFPSEYTDGNHLDLWRVNAYQLVAAGLLSSNIEISSLCTACHLEWFYSHRMSGNGRTGRMIAMLGLKEKP